MITESEVRRNLSANLQRIMDKRGLSQSDLSRMTGISNGTTNRICRGLNVPSATLLARLAEALDTSMDVLLGEPKPERLSKDTTPLELFPVSA